MQAVSCICHLFTSPRHFILAFHTRIKKKDGVRTFPKMHFTFWQMVLGIRSSYFKTSMVENFAWKKNSGMLNVSQAFSRRKKRLKQGENTKKFLLV